ncbi:MAG: hypothetical protein ACLP7O_09130 [Terracidiphilus sp.]
MSTNSPVATPAVTPISGLTAQPFLSLAGERKTQERIAFPLKTGKPPRN